MGWFERLFGGGRRRHPAAAWGGRVPRPAGDADLERYRYLVRTAPPHALEAMHREAFARMTPEQRARALHELNAAVPAGERLHRDDPGALARMATRAELMRPGTVVGALGRPGLGGFFAGSLLSSLVGTVVGSMVAHELLEGFHDHAPDGFSDAPPGADAAPGEEAGGVEHAGLDEGDWGGGGGLDDGADFGGDWGGDAFGTDEL